MTEKETTENNKQPRMTEDLTEDLKPCYSRARQGLRSTSLPNGFPNTVHREQGRSNLS
ncbi:hypothetical protein I3842_08G152300 [Carya illinoinensis]|uniref:Uncharacterized protein n=1 Tax=Carya illinoinensis TaxID=32201 RepID=A0A922EDU2_CARIL|nr:hypothetical protein I3842_08G152300 [Carya illinoinensis]